MIRVLIVEDDPMVAELNKSYLSQIEEFQWIGTVSNGVEALQFLEHNFVNLVLLDIFMPQMNGLELLAKIKVEHRSVDVIMITAARSTNDIQAVLRQGVVDYIIKPFQFDRFQSALVFYRERIRLLSQTDSLDQAALDHRIFIQEKKSISTPKGIENETLERIKNIINSQSAPFSVQDLAPIVGLSRISLKKYFDLLLDEGFLTSSLTYRAKGRPVQLYSPNQMS